MVIVIAFMSLMCVLAHFSCLLPAIHKTLYSGEEVFKIVPSYPV